MEIRCGNGKKFGEVFHNPTGHFEAVCRSEYCRTSEREIVLHVWDLEKINEHGVILPIDTKRVKRPK